jgi:hypothetical protein
MKPVLLLLFLTCASFLTGAAHGASVLTGFPFTDESLAYKISGPAGIPLGDVRFTAKHGSEGWSFEMKSDAGIPGYPVKDTYTSRINSDFCSAVFNRSFEHGHYKGREEESIDRSQETVTRATISGGIGTGGKSQFPISDCVKDALAMVYYTRQELGQGRVPSAQSILLGGLYDITLVYGGPQTIPSGDKTVVTDKVLATVKGPASRVDFEMYFARDAARTPLLVKVPLALGSLSLELVR